MAPTSSSVSLVFAIRTDGFAEFVYYSAFCTHPTPHIHPHSNDKTLCCCSCVTMMNVSTTTKIIVSALAMTALLASRLNHNNNVSSTLNEICKRCSQPFKVILLRMSLTHLPVRYSLLSTTGPCCLRGGSTRQARTQGIQKAPALWRSWFL